jgi:hypothetical protein
MAKGGGMSERDDHEADTEQESKQKRAEGVERMLSGEPPPREPETNEPEPPGEVGGASKVGESVTRRAEEVAAGTKEPGRADSGTEGPAGRPAGTSSARDATSVDPQDDDTARSG